MLESYWNLVKNTGRFWMDGNIRFQVQSSAPATPPASNYEFYAKSTGLFIKNSSGTEIGPLGVGVTDHGALTGLSDDDHSIYALLAGRGTSQTLNGGLSSANNLILVSTAHATKGGIGLGQTPSSIHNGVANEYVQIKRAAGAMLQLVGTGTTSGNTIGELDFGSSSSSASDKRGAVIHCALDASGVTNPTTRMEFYVNNAGSFVQALTLKSAGDVIVDGTVCPNSNFTGRGLYVNHDTNSEILVSAARDATGANAALRFFVTGGTIASPTATLANYGASVGLTGRDSSPANLATNYAQMNFLASQNWTSSARGTYITFETTLDGAASRTERVRINNVGHILVGRTTMVSELAGRRYISIEGDTGAGAGSGGLEFATGQTDADGNGLGIIQWSDKNSTLADKRRAAISATLSGGTANQRGGYFAYFCSANAASGVTEVLRITRTDINHASDVVNRMLSQNRFRYLNTACRVYNNAGQTISNNTFTAVAFQAEEYDSDTLHDNATNNSRITIRLTGKYDIVASSRWAINGSGERVTVVRKNGVATDLIVSSVRGNGSSRDRVVAIGSLSLTAGDYIEQYVLQDSGGNLDLEFSGQETSFEAHYVGE